MLRRAAAALVCTAAAMAIPAQASAATTYYVSPDGDDAAPGTSVDAAWRTPARVDAVDLAPGDHVLFEGGKTFAGGVELDAADAGTAAAPVVLGSYGGGRATLRPGDGAGIYAHDMGGLVVEDLRLAGPGMDLSDGDGLEVYAGGPAGKRQPRVRVERVEASGFGGYGVTIGSWAGLAGYDGIEISDVDAHANALGGIITWAQQREAHRAVTVRRSRAWDNPGRPGLAQNSGNGIVVGGADGGLIEQCVAHDNGGRDDAREGGVGIWAYDSRGVVIQGNESYDNRTGGVADGGGFDLDDRVSDSIVQYNRSHDNDGAGYLIANPSRDAVHAGNVVRFNLSERDGRRNGYAGVTIWRRTSGLEVFHNTVVGPGPAVLASELGDGSAALRDNVLVRTAAGPILSVATSATATAFQGNAYWSPGGRVSFDWAEHEYAGLPAWRAASGAELVGGTATGVDDDPRLGGADEPGPGSPLIGAALDLRPFGLDPGDRDLAGAPLPVGSRLDIGALEAASGNPTPANATASPGGRAGLSSPLHPTRHALASPRLRVDRITRRGRRLHVTGRAARDLPPKSFVRVRARRGRAWGRARRAAVRHGRFSAVAIVPGRKATGARVLVSYAGDRVHRAQRRTFRAP